MKKVSRIIFFVTCLFFVGSSSFAEKSYRTKDLKRIMKPLVIQGDISGDIKQDYLPRIRYGGYVFAKDFYYKNGSYFFRVGYNFSNHRNRWVPIRKQVGEQVFKVTSFYADEELILGEVYLKSTSSKARLKIRIYDDHDNNYTRRGRAAGVSFEFIDLGKKKSLYITRSTNIGPQ